MTTHASWVEILVCLQFVLIRSIVIVMKEVPHIFFYDEHIELPPNNANGKPAHAKKTLPGLKQVGLAETLTSLQQNPWIFN